MIIYNHYGKESKPLVKINFWMLWRNFVCLLWEEESAATALRHDSLQFQRCTYECEFSWKAEMSFDSPDCVSKVLPQQVKSVKTWLGNGKGNDRKKSLCCYKRIDESLTKEKIDQLITLLSNYFISTLQVLNTLLLKEFLSSTQEFQVRQWCLWAHTAHLSAAPECK